jgi:hypothetical protein
MCAPASSVQTRADLPVSASCFPRSEKDYFSSVNFGSDRFYDRQQQYEADSSRN